MPWECHQDKNSIKIKVECNLDKLTCLYRWANCNGKRTKHKPIYGKFHGDSLLSLDAHKLNVNFTMHCISPLVFFSYFFLAFSKAIFHSSRTMPIWLATVIQFRNKMHTQLELPNFLDVYTFHYEIITQHTPTLINLGWISKSCLDSVSWLRQNTMH